MPEVNIVTGAFGFSGAAIARKLFAMGKEIVTLTSKPAPKGDLGARIKAVPWNLDNPAELVRSLSGATTLYNTYWIRFAHGSLTFDKAIENSKTLIRAARDAGVKRIVHVSITNPSLDSPLPYFHGKAVVEEAIKESGLSYAILRPAVLFGDQGILINNMAWFLRRFPVFTIPGDGEYGLAPIFVEDLADLAVCYGADTQDATIDAIGPETYTYNELMKSIAKTVDSRTRLIHVPPPLAYALAQPTGWLLGDVALTWDEVKGLMANLLVSENPPTGKTLLSEWMMENRDWLGTKYMSELKRHFR